jgi:hypothetical protein
MEARNESLLIHGAECSIPLNGPLDELKLLLLVLILPGLYLLGW